MTFGEIETLFGDDTPLCLIGGIGEFDDWVNDDRRISFCFADFVGLTIELV